MIVLKRCPDKTGDRIREVPGLDRCPDYRGGRIIEVAVL